MKSKYINSNNTHCAGCVAGVGVGVGAGALS